MRQLRLRLAKSSQIDVIRKLIQPIKLRAKITSQSNAQPSKNRKSKTAGIDPNAWLQKPCVSESFDDVLLNLKSIDIDSANRVRIVNRNIRSFFEVEHPVRANFEVRASKWKNFLGHCASDVVINYVALAVGKVNQNTVCSVQRHKLVDQIVTGTGLSTREETRRKQSLVEGCKVDLRDMLEFDKILLLNELFHEQVSIVLK